MLADSIIIVASRHFILSDVKLLSIHGAKYIVSMYSVLRFLNVMAMCC